MAVGFNRRLSAVLLAAGLSANAVSADHAFAETEITVLSFADLQGWEDDDHAAAFDTFRNTCLDFDDPDWRAVCAFATKSPNPKEFFELLFRPVLIEDRSPALFTGYFEPELRGSRTRTAKYRYPVYAMPREARAAQPWYTRRELLEDGKLSGRGLEIAWVDDPVELFFLQIQGSGRVHLADGGKLRLGYGGANGHPYRSIGAELVRRGVYSPHQVSATVIKNWVRRNPQAGKELLFHNPSYVFFREVDHVPPNLGPLGAMNRSVTALRTIAVDPAFVPLGAPVWIEKGW